MSGEGVHVDDVYEAAAWVIDQQMSDTIAAAADEIERLRDELARHRALVDELREEGEWSAFLGLFLARHGFGGEPMCPACGHVLRRHDPAEGTCDVFAGMELGTCPCGRSNTT